MNGEYIEKALSNEMHMRAKLANELAGCMAKLEVFKATASHLAASGSSPKKLNDRVGSETERALEIEKKIVETDARISAYEELQKMMPSEPAKLRGGSELAKVETFIRERGGVVTLDEIVKHLGDDGDLNKKKKSLRSTLRSYAREGRVFDFGPDDATFTLLEFKRKPEEVNESAA